MLKELETENGRLKKHVARQISSQGVLDRFGGQGGDRRLEAEI